MGKSFEKRQIKFADRYFVAALTGRLQVIQSVPGTSFISSLNPEYCVYPPKLLPVGVRSAQGLN
jgi:hypothetical protein